MKGVLRTVLLCYLWIPKLRWFLLSGALMVIAGHLWLFASGSINGRAFFGLAIVAMGVAMICMLLVLSTAMVWRSISAPRTLALLPYARLKFLLSVLVAALIPATFVVVNVALLRVEAPGTPLAQTNLAYLWVHTLGIETTFILSVFLLSGSLPTVALSVLATLIGIILWARVIVSGVTFRMTTTPLIALAITCAWGAFAVGYLSVRRIVPPTRQGGWGENVWTFLKRDEKIPISRDSAITVQLLGLPSIARLMQRSLFLLIAIGMGVFLWYLANSGTTRGRDPTSLLMGLLLLGLVLTGLLPTVISAEVARRCKTLWLRASCSREQLFLLCERLCWYCFGAVSLTILPIVIVAWTFLPHPESNGLYALVAMSVPGVCGLYLGLMNVAGWQVVDVIVAILIVIIGWGTAVTAALHSTAVVTPAMMVVLITQLFGALALRWVAKRRWHHIDWLICKPQRLSSQALKPVF